jgi:hypothetical protein
LKNSWFLALENCVLKASQKSKMLMTFEILVMRRLMKQIGQNAITQKRGLKLNKSTIKLSQKRMDYETFLSLNFSCQKVAFFLPRKC